MHVLKNHLVAFLGEFIGTFLFLFFAFGGTQTANFASQQSTVTVPNVPQQMYVATVFGFSLAINVWVFFRISGGLFNPAVTLALVLVGVVPPIRAIFIFVAQVVAGIAAAAAVKGLVPGDVVLFVVNLSPGVSKVQGLFLEMFFTLLLVFAILMLAAEKTKSTFIAPIGIGLALFVAELFGVFWTGGAVNPARAFGPAVIQGFQSTHWVYWVGPILGGMIAAGIYKLFKFLNYEEVNGTQDLTPAEEEDVERAEKRKMHKRRSSRRHSTHNGDRSEKGYRSDREGDRSERGYRSDREDPESANTIVPAKPSTGHAPPPRRSAQYDAPIVYDYNGKPYYQDPNAQAPSTGPYVLHPQSAPAQAAKPPRSSKTYI